MRLKDITTLNPQYRGKELYNNVSFVPMESLRNGSIDLKDISFAEGKGKYTYFGNGDLLVAKVTPCFENGNIAIADNLEHGIGFGSSEIFVLRMKKGFLNSYLFYLSQTSKFQDAACATMCGVGGLKRISPLFMRTYELDLPVLSEQQRIVEKLDTQLSSIDKRISVLEQQLDAYARFKKSVIHQAVTRGLNPNVTLKDSGIEWIGMIPKHWEIRRFKEIFLRYSTGLTPESKNYEQLKDDALANARKITESTNSSKLLPNESVDMILTSPPYASAQKYIRSSSLSLYWLRMLNGMTLADLDSQNIGRENYNKSSVKIQPTGIGDADEVIEKIFNQYPLRGRIVCNYLLEMQKALDESYRVLKKGRYMIIIIGNNNVCGHQFNTKHYIAEYLESKGMQLELQLIDDIKSYGLMTKRNKTADIITREWILVFKKL